MRRPRLTELTSSAAVRDAIAEHDRLGPKEFLAKYGYGEAREYFLEFEGRQYDSKAIAGVAFGYQFPDRGPLTSKQFSGGASTVQKKLEELGFKVVVVQRTARERSSGKSASTTTDTKS